MTIRLEVFAAGSAAPDDVWALVGDPRRLPEWTDADTVELTGSLEPGATVVTRDAGRRLVWTVATVEPRLLELVTNLPGGRLGIGVRVLRDALGSRVILAGALDPASAQARWKFRLSGAGKLRRRFDRWSQHAVRAQPPRDPAGGR